MKLGDLEIVRRPDGSLPPLKLIKCLTVIAMRLHQEFSRPIYNHKKPDQSKESCVLCSLTVRDFLRRSGFRRASVAPVQVAMVAHKDGELLHSLGIGQPEAKGSGWKGHMVVICNGWLIDTTLYQAIRPQWDHLSPMLVVPIQRVSGKVFGLYPLSAMGTTDGHGYDFLISWGDDPRNEAWRSAPDAKPERRRPVVEHLLDTLKGGSAAPDLVINNNDGD